MGYASRAGRARTSPTSPQAHAICDRCGFRYNRVDLRFQMDWAGALMVNKRLLVCDRCYDEPQAQLRAFVIPADPVPVATPRPENFERASTDRRVTSVLPGIDAQTGLPIAGGDVRVTEGDDVRVTQQTGAAVGSLNEEPGVDPNVEGPINTPPGNTSIPQTGPL